MERPMTKTLIISAAIAGVVGVAGCAQQAGPRPLTADAFVSRQETDADAGARVDPVDKSGPVLYDNVVNVPLIPQDAPDARRESGGVSKGVRELVRSVDKPIPADIQPVPGAPATRPLPAVPATRPAVATGQYQELGSVLAVVNGQPIYAHKVLASLETSLSAEAKRNDPRAFRGLAKELITGEIGKLVRDELVFAAAQKSLSVNDKRIADFLTTQWRDRQITLAGGAIEMAKRKAAEEGVDFDEQVRDRYRRYMAELYFSRRIAPLVSISQSDIRNYYDANKEKEFTKKGAVQFRLIKVDPSNFPGGVAQARDKAETLRARALKEDFTHLAAVANTDDRNLARNEGRVGSKDQDWWIEQGAFALEEVEKAVWQLRPGEVSPVVKDRGGLYIAKLEAKREAATQPFDDLKVQEAIQEKLRGEQLRVLHEKAVLELRKNAIVQENPQMLDVALEMAMQRYPAWASATQ